MPQIDCFGFLPYKESFKFLNYQIIPLNDFDKKFDSFKKNINVNGFYYPPNEYSVSVDISTGKGKRVPNSERPAYMHRLPASHQLVFPDSGLKLTDARFGIPEFIVNVLSFLFGFRLQFFNRWVDMKIPMESQSCVLVTKNDIEKFSANAIQQWAQRNAYQKILFNNLLFMHTRNPSYFWDWERFMMEYAVFDGCWRFYFSRNRLKKEPGHGERMKVILNAFNMQVYDKEINKIVDLRKNLFHETLWDGKQPCTRVSEEAFMSYDTLKRINHRLITALLNYKTDYIKTDWRSIGQCLFTKNKGWRFPQAPF